MLNSKVTKISPTYYGKVALFLQFHNIKKISWKTCNDEKRRSKSSNECISNFRSKNHFYHGIRFVLSYWMEFNVSYSMYFFFIYFPKVLSFFFYFLSKFREMNLIYCDSGNKSQRNVIEYSKEQHQINLLTQKKLSMLRATCELWMQAVAMIVAHCATHDWLFLPLIF